MAQDATGSRSGGTRCTWCNHACLPLTCYSPAHRQYNNNMLFSGWGCRNWGRFGASFLEIIVEILYYLG